MIFGFNTDVPANGKTYHVQTEDRGAKNPIVDSIIYLGGKIIDRVRTPYDISNTAQEQIEALVRTQHRELVDTIRAGSFTPHAVAPEPDVAPPSGYGIRLLNSNEIERDGKLHFEIEVWDRRQPGPGAGVTLDVHWRAGANEAQRSRVQTESDGRAAVTFAIPPEGTDAELLISAIGADGHEVVKFRVHQSTATSRHP